ncbi:MAG TPA: hypothetical protein VK324_17670 [Tepidisphaeraceae bacterium]|nr:hypothetical protein [Tepidisphaeraceae bacterium]
MKSSTKSQPSRSAKAEPSEPNVNQQKAATAPPAAVDGARKTLFCLSINTPDHVRQANDLKQQLLTSTNMPDWYVVHTDAASIVYYGYYKAIDKANPAEARRAKADLEKIRTIANARGEKMFRGAVFVETGTDDPAAPADWNLANLPADKFWTLLVADFVDIPNRKEAAVDAVREARKLGYDAYFYHGPTASSVYVGAWPRNAIREQDADQAATYNPDQPILVSPEPLPRKVRETDTREIDWGAVYLGGKGGSKQRMKVITPRVEITDASLRRTMEDTNLQRYALNGAQTPDPPALTDVTEIRRNGAGPRPGGAADLASSPLLDGGGADDAATGVGRLRGVGQ